MRPPGRPESRSTGGCFPPAPATGALQKGREQRTLLYLPVADDIKGLPLALAPGSVFLASCPLMAPSSPLPPNEGPSWTWAPLLALLPLPPSLLPRQALGGARALPGCTCACSGTQEKRLSWPHRFPGKVSSGTPEPRAAPGAQRAPEEGGRGAAAPGKVSRVVSRVLLPQSSSLSPTHLPHGKVDT